MALCYIGFAESCHCASQHISRALTQGHVHVMQSCFSMPVFNKSKCL